MENEEIKMQDDFLDNDANDALTLSDLSAGYVPAAKVGGDAIEFTVKQVNKLTGSQLIGKKREGGTFKKNLSNVDYGYEVITASGDKYGVSSWEVFGKMKSIFQKLQKIAGVKLHIKHIKDGMKDKEGDNYIVAAEVKGVFNTLDRNSKEWSIL